MANKFAKMFVPGALTVPERLLKKDAFCAGARIVVPNTYIVEGALTQVENQGQFPYCAAYSASTFAESVLWRKRGYPEQIDPVPLYRYCKTIDGDPYGDGTSLNAALQSLLHFEYFDPKICRVRTFGGSMFGSDPDTALLNLKAAVFRFGACVIGCNIDSSWYSPKNGVIQGGGATQGGHAILAHSYDEDGIVIRNSWGADYGTNGDAYIPNRVFAKQFMYAAVMSNALDGAL